MSAMEFEGIFNFSQYKPLCYLELGNVKIGKINIGRDFVSLLSHENSFLNFEL